RKLGRIGDSQAIEYLKDLWNRGDALKSLRNPEITDDPVVRIMIAQQLLENGVIKKAEYGNYIKSQAQIQNWIIRSNAADALAAVDDTESVELLYKISLTPHRLVALRAVRSLEYLSRSGTMSEEAVEALEGLLSDPNLEDQEVKQEI